MIGTLVAAGCAGPPAPPATGTATVAATTVTVTDTAVPQILEDLADAATGTRPAAQPATTHTTHPTAAGGGTPAATPRYRLIAAPATARERLAGLAVKGRAPATGYSRREFGQRWSDDVTVEFGHNGCDTRNDILRRDLAAVSAKPGTRGCVVQSGVLDGPYTGRTISFRRGQHTSAKVHIDHVVALSDAWQKGAQQLDGDTRRNFANDPDNLLAVDGAANMAKRDGDAATWLPPNKPFRCAYAIRQIVVKDRYRLWVTQAEHDALARQLDTCPQ
ncbi:HNH endonuclease [Corynebacterium sp. CCM 8862]|uniref:HNH endonuclease n=1 Tax=Corynebacterium mendelii TaxID=2765362 RepID=A0A939E1X5_9CORY|nr:HNH endonuclease [Corynebacterium mendelii]